MQADDLLRQADDLLAQMAQGNFKKSDPAEAAHQQRMDDAGPGYQLQCDVNGCTIVPVARQDAARTPSSAIPVMSLQCTENTGSTHSHPTRSQLQGHA